MAAQIIAFPKGRIFRSTADRKRLAQIFKRAMAKLPHLDGLDAFDFAVTGLEVSKELKKIKRGQAKQQQR